MQEGSNKPGLGGDSLDAEEKDLERERLLRWKLASLGSLPGVAGPPLSVAQAAERGRAVGKKFGEWEKSGAPINEVVVRTVAGGHMTVERKDLDTNFCMYAFATPLRTDEVLHFYRKGDKDHDEVLLHRVMVSQLGHKGYRFKRKYRNGQTLRLNVIPRQNSTYEIAVRWSKAQAERPWLTRDRLESWMFLVSPFLAIGGFLLHRLNRGVRYACVGLAFGIIAMAAAQNHFSPNRALVYGPAGDERWSVNIYMSADTPNVTSIEEWGEIAAERSKMADGLGPVYNAQSCAECHQNPVSGGVNQVFEMRAGHTASDVTFVDAHGGSLIQTRNVNAKIQEHVPDVVSSLSLSPDGALITVSSGGYLWFINSDGTNPNRITITNADFESAWSPDGTKIAFQRTPDAANPVSKALTITSTRSAQTQVTLGAGNDERPTWAPDGTTIAFSTTRNGNYEIYNIAVTGGLATQLTNNPTPDHSPVLWAIATHGSNATQVHWNNAGGGDRPAHSKDQREMIRALRDSLNVLGDGFVDCIDGNTLATIANSQPNQSGDRFITIPVLEANDATRLERFGWKNQHASLLSFSSDAYLNEQGITNRFNLVENTSLGASVAAFDPVPSNQPCANVPNTICGEDAEDDMSEFTEFMRASKSPPRDTFGLNANDVADGHSLFNSTGCPICHVRNITPSPAGTLINGGAFTVPVALRGKAVYPFSDFLLHDTGTGDRIVQNGGLMTRLKVGTAPLWGMRTRDGPDARRPLADLKRSYLAPRGRGHVEHEQLQAAQLDTEKTTHTLP